MNGIANFVARATHESEHNLRHGPDHVFADMRTSDSLTCRSPKEPRVLFAPDMLPCMRIKTRIGRAFEIRQSILLC
jgi:hypothetical protein